MKSVILLSLFLCLSFLSGRAQESQINNFLASENGEIPSLLLSHDYHKKSQILNHIQDSDFINQLKSSNGNYLLDSIVTKAWSDDLNLFENSFKYVYSFKNEGRNIVMKIYSWNSELAKWSKTFDMYYYFNADDKLIQTEFELYVTSIYKMYTKIEYVYTNVLLTEESFYTKYEEEESWLKDGATYYFYNSNDKLIEAKTNVWDDYLQTWIDGEKTEYSYNSAGNLTTESEYSWDDYSTEWSQNSRTENSFDSKNNLIESIKYKSGIVPGTLELDTKMEYMYDSKTILHEILYEWEYDLLIWLEKEKVEYSDTETNKLYKINSYTWIENQHSWKNTDKSEFFSVNLLTQQELLYRQYVDVYLPVFVFDDMVCDLINDYNWNGNEWGKTNITSYYFSPTTGIEFDKLAKVKVQIYPNPTTEYLNIEINNAQESVCRIRDINGRTISQFPVFQEKRWNLSNYQSGIYLLEIQQNNQRIFTNKIIKK